MLRVAGVYTGSALGIIYAADVILPRLAAPEWAVTAIIVIGGLGLFVVVGLSWAFDITPGGVVRTEPLPADATKAGGQPRLDRRAIAVLPFENMSADGTDDYFGDGISEEIINALAHLPELRVAGRTSAFNFKGMNADLREVGQKLSVGTVLEGSVRRMGDCVRITAQLIDTNDGYHIWSERYDRQLHDIFHVQDEIARAIAGHLAVKLGARSHAPLIAQHPDDPAAYQSYLTGRHYISQMTDDGFTRSAEAYRAAIERVPDYALAWAGLAEVEMLRGMLMDEPYAESPARAARGAESAGVERQHCGGACRARHAANVL